MTAHTAGEAAMDELLTAYERADRAVGIRGRRWLITHANFTSAENLRADSRRSRSSSEKRGKSISLISRWTQSPAWLLRVADLPADTGTTRNSSSVPRLQPT